MPASAARIAFVSQAFRTAVSDATEGAAIRARYGAAARDTRDEPIETMWDSVADVQAVTDERFDLLKRDARKFEVRFASLLSFAGGLSFLQTVPAATLIDDEKVANMPVAITSINALDYETGKTTLTVWG